MKAAWKNGLSPDKQINMTTTANAVIALAERVKILFAHGPRAYLFSSVSACILITILWPVAEPQTLLLWLTVIISISMLRWALAQYYALTPQTTYQATTWHRYFLIGVTCAGTIWGSTAIFLFPAASPAHQFFLIFVLAGITTAAVPTLAASRIAFLYFAIPALGPMIIRFLSSPDAMSLAMGALSLLYLLALIKSAQLTENRMQECFQVRDQNATLQALLANAQNALHDKEQAQRELQHSLHTSQQRLQDFAETASEWFWEMDEQLRFSYLSERFVKATGIPAETIIGCTRDEIYQGHAAAESGALEQHFRVIENRESFSDVEFHIHGPNNEAIVISISGKPVVDPSGRFLGYRGTGRNITYAYKANQLLHFQASHDAMTGLANRHHLEIELQQIFDQTKALRGEHALCFMDLDRFKLINASYGHTAGDTLLCQLAVLLSSFTRKQDVLARLGGDEFALLLKDCTIKQARRIARTLCQTVEKFQCSWQDSSIGTSISIGLIPINQHTDTARAALSDAENACFIAKKLGRNEVHCIVPSAGEQTQRQLEISYLTRLEQALSQDQFKLYYQSIKPLSHHDKSAGIHFELLLRLDDGLGNSITPDVFLPIAEKYGIAPQIDRWVINAALHWLQQYLNNPVHTGTHPVIGINLSGQSLSNLRLLDYIQERLAHYKIAPKMICFEITETAAIANIDNAVLLIQRLRNRGCRFALDDFGSGFSSYAYLKNLDVDYIKIDGSFIKDIANNTLNRTMVQSIQAIGQALGKKTIAEHVENDPTVQILRDIGVDYIQGYHIDIPRPLALHQPSERVVLPGRANLRVVS